MPEVKKTFDISLDLKRSGNREPIELVGGDTGNEFHITLTESGAAVDLSDCRVIAVFTNSAGTAMQDGGTEDGGVTVGGDSHNEITIDLFSGSYAPNGVTECELQIYSGTDSATLVTTARFNFKSRTAIISDETIQAQDEYPVLANLIAQVTGLASDAETAATEANAAAEAATAAVSSIWTGTLAEYNALTTHAPGGIYLIKEE